MSATQALELVESAAARGWIERPEDRLRLVRRAIARRWLVPQEPDERGIAAALADKHRDSAREWKRRQRIKA